MQNIRILNLRIETTHDFILLISHNHVIDPVSLDNPQVISLEIAENLTSKRI